MFSKNLYESIEDLDDLITKNNLDDAETVSGEEIDELLNIGEAETEADRMFDEKNLDS